MLSALVSGLPLCSCHHSQRGPFLIHPAPPEPKTPRGIVELRGWGPEPSVSSLCVLLPSQPPSAHFKSGAATLMAPKKKKK